MEKIIYGYVRVSSRDQNEIRQINAMTEWGIDKKHIFTDKQSGKNFERPSYQKMLKKVRKGDVIVIQSIDRLGRNYNDILEQWALITKQKQADIVVIDMPLLDTREKKDDLTGRFIADLVLQILSYVAQTEREFIKKRQAEGIAAAKEKGVVFGAKKKEIPQDFPEYKQKWENGQISLRQAAAVLDISHTTFHRLCKAEQAQIQ